MKAQHILRQKSSISVQALTATCLMIGITFAFTGCVSERLRENTVEVGATSSDILYEMALSNIAMFRYYNYARVLPVSYQVGTGNITVNDTAGATPAATFGLSASHTFTPSLTIPYTRSQQQYWTISPNLNPASTNLPAIQTAYINAAKDTANFINGSAPQGSLKGSYRGFEVWVSSTNVAGMEALTQLLTNVSGFVQPPSTNKVTGIRIEQSGVIPLIQ